MTEEMSRHQIKGLAQDNVGALDEVEVAVELLRAVVPVINRARKACRDNGRIYAQKAVKDDDYEESATADEMYNADAKFACIVNIIEEMQTYI